MERLLPFLAHSAWQLHMLKLQTPRNKTQFGLKSSITICFDGCKHPQRHTTEWTQKKIEIWPQKPLKQKDNLAYIPQNIVQCSEQYIHCHVKKRQTRQSPTPNVEQFKHKFLIVKNRSIFWLSIDNWSEICFIHYVLRLFHMTLTTCRFYPVWQNQN